MHPREQHYCYPKTGTGGPTLCAASEMCVADKHKSACIPIDATTPDLETLLYPASGTATREIVTSACGSGMRLEDLTSLHFQGSTFIKYQSASECPMSGPEAHSEQMFCSVHDKEFKIKVKPSDVNYFKPVCKTQAEFLSSIDLFR